MSGAWCARAVRSSGSSPGSRPIAASCCSLSSAILFAGLLQEGCRRIQVPAIPVLDPVIGALASYLGRESRGLPGKQHLLDSEYFARIDAMTFALNHDDGQSSWGLNDADVCLVGVSRTSKTPTCLYLANRGIKAANVPFVPGVPLPPELLEAKHPLIVGLTNDPERLIQLRRNRLDLLHHDQATEYTEYRCGANRGARGAPGICRKTLAGYRRNAPLDRGNGGRDHEAAGAATRSG